MHSYQYDRPRARFFLHAAGVLDAAECMTATMELTIALRDAAHAGRRLTILAVLDGVGTGDRAFRLTEARALAMLADGPIARLAVVAPRAAIRARVRRLAGALDPQLFTDAAAAAAWLGWPDDYHAQLGWLATVDAVAA